MGIVVHERWTCRICTSSDLDTRVHRCCPNCGHQRDVDPVRLPTWEEFLAPPTDRFSGLHTTCCNQCYSEEARFCGQCATPLELAERLKGPIAPLGLLVSLGAIAQGGAHAA